MIIFVLYSFIQFNSLITLPWFPPRWRSIKMMEKIGIIIVEGSQQHWVKVRFYRRRIPDGL